MKKHGFEVSDYNLPNSIRKRIDDLVELNINPSTISAITTEFSSSSDEIRENIGRYIARLLEIQDIVISEAENKSNEFNNAINLKHVLSFKNRKTNLLRIQQIFSKNDKEKDEVDSVRTKNREMNNSLNALYNFKEAMIINNGKEISKLEQIAAKKRRIEIAILEEQQKIKIAQKQYQKAKIEDDEITQELKINAVKFANKRLKEISEAISTYKTVELIPDEIINNNFSTHKREFLNKNDKTNFEKLQEDIKMLNSKKENSNVSKTLEIDLETFFDVPGFEEYEQKLENKRKKPVKRKVNTNNKKVEQKKEIKQETKTKNDDAEKIIKKIKKKARAKDRQIDKIKKEKEEIKKELIQLKQEKKIIELRELEIKKRKLNENFEDTVKKERRKIETTYQILEKK